MPRRGRAFVLVGAAGLVLAVLGQIEALGPLASTGIGAASRVMLALITHGGAPLATEAVGLGASGVGYDGTASGVPLVASGLLLTFVFGTRAMRSRTWRELGVHLTLAFASGVAASWVARADAGLEITLWMTAIMVAALLASAPWLLPSDAPRTFALRRLAGRARGTARVRMLRAVVAHRQLRDVELPTALRRGVERAFDAVIRRGAPRLDADGAHRTIEQLVRVARAARARDERLADLDDCAAQAAHLEAQVAALAQLG